MKTSFEEFKNDLLDEIDFPDCPYLLLYALVFCDGEIIISPFNKTFPDREHYDNYLFSRIIDVSRLEYYDDILEDWISDLYESISDDFDFWDSRR